MSLLQRHIQPDMSMASKFDYLLNYYRRSPPLYVIIDTPLYIPLYLKGTVARDFTALVFFIKSAHLGP
jgi:hypothetical protein